MSTAEDLAMDHSSSSLPGTPVVSSNPGTPRSMNVEAEAVRGTPPPNPQVVAAQASEVVVRKTPPPQLTVPTSLSAKASHVMAQQHQSKYAQLLAVIEEMGRDIRPTYSGGRSSAERLKRGIVHARILVRECLMECERAART